MSTAARPTPRSPTASWIWDVAPRAAIVARGSQILFARVIPIGGDHFSRAVADALKINLTMPRVLRVKLAMSRRAPSRKPRNLSMRQRTTLNASILAQLSLIG